jgi:hypothetical protein
MGDFRIVEANIRQSGPHMPEQLGVRCVLRTCNTQSIDRGVGHFSARREPLPITDIRLLRFHVRKLGGLSIRLRLASDSPQKDGNDFQGRFQAVIDAGNTIGKRCGKEPQEVKRPQA